MLGVQASVVGSMKLLDLLVELDKLCRFRSTEGKAELSKSELKRWFDKGSVLINGEKAKWDEPFDFPVFSMVLHPKGERKCSLL